LDKVDVVQNLLNVGEGTAKSIFGATLGVLTFIIYAVIAKYVAKQRRANRRYSKRRFMVLLTLFATMMFMVVPLSVSAAAVYDHEVTFDMNGGDYLHDDMQYIGSKMRSASEPLSILCIGDSTSNDPTEWFYLAATDIADELEDYSIEYRLWNSSTNSYDTKTTIQYGAEDDAYAEYDGNTGNYLSAIDSTDLSVTGDIDVRAKVLFEPGENGTVVSKWDTTGNNSFFMYFGLAADGTSATIQFYWTADGSTNINNSSSVFTITANTEIWIRTTLDVDNGGGGYTTAYYYSLDGITYTNINSVVTAAGTTSIYDSTANIEIGGRSGGTGTMFEGKIYEAEIRNGIAGEIVASPNLDQAFPSTVNSFKDVEGNTWILNGDVSVGNGSPGIVLLNGSIAGAKSSTFNATVLNDMIDMDVDFVMINLGHNEDTNDTYVSQLESFVESVLVYTGNIPVMLVTQNPQTSPRTTAQIAAQNVRMDQVILVASLHDYILVDSGAVLGSDASTYISTDGVHPTAAGYDVWADQVTDMFVYAINGGGYSEITVLVEDGELVTEPSDPSKTGEVFVGWYTDEALTDEWNFSTDLVQNDITLYAKYTDSTTGAVTVDDILDGIDLGSALLSITATAFIVFAAAYLINKNKRKFRRRR
jgi:uncharacterized repeat protein (TIGR02543 family)